MKNYVSLFRILALSLGIVIAASAQGAILVAAADSSARDFEIFARLNSDDTKVSDFQLQNLPSSDDKQFLFDEFVLAKNYYFSQDPDRAKTTFKNIMKKSLKLSWMTDVRAVFFDSALYLSLLETSVSDQKKWLHESVRWKPERILWSEWPNATRNAFIKEEEIAFSAAPTRLNLRTLHIHHAILNGIVLDVQKDLPVIILDGENALTLLDDQHEPALTTITSSHSSVVQSGSAIVTGSCEKPSVQAPYEKIELTVFFHPGCVWSKSADGVWTNSKTAKFLDPKSSGYFQTMAAWPKPVSTEHFYQKPLFWVGLVAVIAIAIKISSDQSRSSETTQVARP